MSILKVFLLLSVTVLTAQAKDIQCRGGDGPTPFMDISHSLSQSVEEIPTVGEVRGFIHWPRRGAIVYQNANSQLRKVNYKSGKDKLLARLLLPLSRLADPEEKFILTDRANWYLDTEQANVTWGHFETARPVHHLFWHRTFLGANHLFSISDSLSKFFAERQPDRQDLQILKFTAGNISPEACHLHPQPGEVFYLGDSFHYFFDKDGLVALAPVGHGRHIGRIRL